MAVENRWGNSATHLLCIYHIYRNIQENLGNFHYILIQFYLADILGNKGDIFKKEFSSVLREDKEANFETEFVKFKEKYTEDLCSKNKAEGETCKKYLEGLYKEKKKWANCYTYQHFTAGINY